MRPNPIRDLFHFLFFVFMYCQVTSEVSTARDVNNLRVEGVLGSPVKIPCMELSDDVNFVIWTKGDEKRDLYTLDSRNVPLVKGEHHTNDNRMSFMPLENPSYLLLKNLKKEDEGSYDCFVVNRKRYTQSIRTYLKVIVPPERIKIFNSKGEEVVNIKSDQLEENSTVEFTCQVTGGKPEPIITWWKGAELLDNQVDLDGTQVLRNRLQYGPLTRADQSLDLVCQASNSNLTAPLSQKITLDINYSPLTVEIITEDSPLIADSEFQIICRSDGAKPPAIITWMLENKVLNTTNDFTTNNGNTTQSILRFTPTDEDGGKTLTCKAESTVIVTKPLTDKRILDIYYPPKVKLSMSPTENIVEGDEVTLRCDVISNPKTANITWFQRGNEIEEKNKKKITIEDNLLILSSVTRKMSGIYTCIATNQVGIGESNPVLLHIKYVPVCSESETQIVGASIDEEIKVNCNLKASPKINTFRWQYNSLHEEFDILDDQFSKEEKRSVLRYKPLSRKDFGHLKCWGTNELGEQMEPCVFLVVEAGFPDKPENCTFLGNYTTSSVFVRCAEGHDGGLPQSFIAEVFDMQRKILTRNISVSEPYFFLSDLPPATDFLLTIYSANGKGVSEKQLLQVYTAVPTEKSLFSIDSFHEFPITPILGVLIGIVGALVIVAVIIIVVTRLRPDPPEKKPPKDDANGVRAPLHPRDGGESGIDSGNGRSDSFTDAREIPSKLKHVNLYETVAYETVEGGKQSEILSDKSSDRDADDVEYAELNFNNEKKRKTKKSKSEKPSPKTNGKVHSSYDPTLYVSIDHVQTEKKKLIEREKGLQQHQLKQQLQQEQLENATNQMQAQQPNESHQHQNNEITSPILISQPQKQQLPKSDSVFLPPSPPPPLSTSEMPLGLFTGGTPRESKAPIYPILRPYSDKTPVSEDHQKILNQDSIPIPKPQEIGAKKTGGKPTSLDKPPIAKKPQFAQDLIKKKKKTAETQTDDEREIIKKKEERNLVSNEDIKEDIPLMDSTIESSL